MAVGHAYELFGLHLVDRGAAFLMYLPAALVGRFRFRRLLDRGLGRRLCGRLFDHRLCRARLGELRAQLLGTCVRVCRRGLRRRLRRGLRAPAQEAVGGDPADGSADPGGEAAHAPMLQ